MSESGSTALRRMIGAARQVPAHGSVRVEDALRLALSRAGQDALRIAVTAGAIRSDRAGIGALGGLLPRDGLWVTLQGPHRLRGVVGLDASLLAGLVQALTLGQVRRDDTTAPRKTTQTDAMLLRRFLAVLLDTLARRLDGQPQGAWAAGYQPRDRIADAARLPHVLPDMPYHVLGCDVDVADGARKGTIVLALPEAGPVAQMDNPQAAERAAFTAALAQTLSDAPADLEAVLCRMTLSLDTVTGLAPDMVLPIPRHSVGEVVLQGCDGRPAAVARLGQSRGLRAVKIVSITGCDAGAVRADDTSPPATDSATSPVPVPVPVKAPQTAS